LRRNGSSHVRRIEMIRYSNPTEVLSGAPGPSPWYLRWDSPKLDGFKWKEPDDEPEKKGRMLLLNSKGNAVAVINMYTYTMALDEHSVLIWRQQYATKPADTIQFEVVNLMSLPEIFDLQDAYKSMGDYRSGQYVFYQGQSSLRFKVRTNLTLRKQSYDFPGALSKLDELLVLASLTGEAAADYRESAVTMSIFALRPASNSIEIYPQDWFNTGGLDYGYQWVTRVAREPKSGKIYGEGFRISPFVLDETSRNIEKKFDQT